MPRPTVKLNQLSHFEDFSAQLYCAGASEQLCRVNGAPVASGVCHWRLPAGASVTVDDINTAAGKLRMASDRWDPRTDGIPGEFRKYGPLAASECVRGRRLLIAGDSTTRDTFYELLAVAGHPISLNYPTNPREYWGVHDFEPRKLPTGASDAFGVCIGNYDKQLTCLRDVRWGSRNETSVLFHFLTRSNSTWELDLFSQHVGDQPLDAAFVQCASPPKTKPTSENKTAFPLAENKLHTEQRRHGGQTPRTPSQGNGPLLLAVTVVPPRPRRCWPFPATPTSRAHMAVGRFPPFPRRCPMYEWMKPDAYNYSLSRQERGKVLGPWEVRGIGCGRGGHLIHKWGWGAGVEVRDWSGVDRKWRAGDGASRKLASSSLTSFEKALSSSHVSGAAPKPYPLHPSADRPSPVFDQFPLPPFH